MRLDIEAQAVPEPCMRVRLFLATQLSKEQSSASQTCTPSHRERHRRSRYRALTTPSLTMTRSVYPIGVLAVCCRMNFSFAKRRWHPLAEQCTAGKWRGGDLARDTTANAFASLPTSLPRGEAKAQSFLRFSCLDAWLGGLEVSVCGNAVRRSLAGYATAEERDAIYLQVTTTIDRG